MNDGRLPYSPEAFVDRETEIGLVQGLTEQILQRATERPRAVIFQGERGSGKSWLALHLARTVLPAMPGVIPVLISLGAPPDDRPTMDNELFINVSPEVISPDESTLSILAWLAGRLKTTTAENASARELATWLVRDIEIFYPAQALVFILDSALEADWNFLAQLETHLLAPLALLPRVLIVMTGRGQPYSWESPYLRVDVQNEHLQPFDEAKIQLQLERQHIKSNKTPREIFELGGGHPLANLLLAQNEDTLEAMEQAVEVLLSVVQPAHRYQQVRQYFEALCVLDGFREEEMAQMFAAYFGPQSGDWDIARVRAAWDDCVRTHLMRWENSQFIIDKSLRLILQNLLRLLSPNTRWQMLEERAYQMYSAWAKQYPRSAAYYQAKADSHARALQAPTH
jgi:energy-coupling factor transporter ATP-binding protein EcfA2